MNWLKKLGSIAKMSSQLIPVFGPLVASIIPGEKDDRIVTRVTDTLGQVGNVIAQAEIFSAALSLPGAQKLEAAAPSVAQLILQSSLLAGKKVKDPARFEAAVKGLASNVAEILSSVEEEEAAPR